MTVQRPQGQWTEADYFSLPDMNRFMELSEGTWVEGEVIMGSERP